jgi:hypothetical protein
MNHRIFRLIAAAILLNSIGSYAGGKPSDPKSALCPVLVRTPSLYPDPIVCDVGVTRLMVHGQTLVDSSSPKGAELGRRVASGEEVFDDGIVPALALSLAKQTVEEVSRMLGKLEMPVCLDISVSPIGTAITDDSAHASIGYPCIATTSRWTGSKLDRQTSNFVLVHEIGHHISWHNLVEDLQKEEAFQQKKYIIAFLRSEGLSPYAELFSDLLGAIHERDPEAFPKLLIQESGNKGEKITENRHANRSFKRPSTVPEYSGRDHDFFGNVRWHIGEKYLAAAIAHPEYSKKLLYAVYTVMKEAALDQYRRHHFGPLRDRLELNQNVEARLTELMAQ